MKRSGVNQDDEKNKRENTKGLNWYYLERGNGGVAFSSHFLRFFFSFFFLTSDNFVNREYTRGMHTIHKYYLPLLFQKEGYSMRGMRYFLPCYSPLKVFFWFPR